MLRAGADKVSVNTAAVQRPELIAEIAAEFGAQCVVCAIDAKRRPTGPGFEVYLHGGRTPTGIDAVAWAADAAALGAGEILLTSMDRDGTKRRLRPRADRGRSADAVGVPVIASGGVGTLEHLVDGIIEGGADAVLAASIFHFGEHTIAEAKAVMAAAGDHRPHHVTSPVSRMVPTMTDADGVPPPRPHRDQGVGAVVRLVGHVRHPDEGRPGDGVHAGGVRRRLQLLRQRRGLRRRRERGDHGPRHRRARLAALVVRADDEGVLGPPRRAQHAEHAQPQVPDARHRRSLERLGIDFVDVLYCHRADPDTTLEETVWAMSDIVSSGKALYWGTSEWAADEIRGAIEIAERHHLHKPVTEQPQYNLLERHRVEKEYARLYAETGYGATIWSPLASGLLTGKYRDGIPEDSRGALPATAGWPSGCRTPGTLAKVERLRPIADELGCSLAQLALAWCTDEPDVSTVITGASRPSQVVENFGAMDVVAPPRRRRPRPHRRRRQVGVAGLSVRRATARRSSRCTSSSSM